MTRYIAFLRAINVGGRVVTMNRLRDVFVALGFRDVETFIASGNVIFSARSTDRAALERRIERALADALGYEVATFLRTPDEVAAVAVYAPFPADAVARSRVMHVGVLGAPLPPAATEALAKLETPIDRFHVYGREVYWLCSGAPGESRIANGVLERAVKARATFRSVNTFRRLHARLTAAPAAGGGSLPRRSVGSSSASRKKSR